MPKHLLVEVLQRDSDDGDGKRKGSFEVSLWKTEQIFMYYMVITFCVLIVRHSGNGCVLDAVEQHSGERPML
jgi:hypothetical protein